MIPTITGHTTSTGSGGSSSITVNPTSNLVGTAVADGDWIIITFMSPSALATSKQPTAPGDWTNIVPFNTVGSGTMSFGVWAHQRTSGESTYAWTQSTAETNGTYYRMIFVSGADTISNWTIGSFDLRQNTGTTTTNVASSITTTVNNSLALLLAGERTVAAETDTQVTCDNFTKQWFDNSLTDCSFFVASKDMATTGSTGSSTVTYPNTHSYNGIAGILGIPPPPPPIAPLMWVLAKNTMPAGIKRNTAEGQTSGTTLTAANSGAGSGDAFDIVSPTGTVTRQFSNAYAAHDTQSYVITASASSNLLLVYNTSSDMSGATQAYFYFTAYPDSNNGLITSYVSGGKGGVAINSAGRLIVNDAVSQIAQSSAGVIPLNTWVRIDLCMTVGGTTSTGRVQAAISLGDNPTPEYSYDSGATVNTGTVAFASYRFGKLDGTPNIATYYIDDIAFVSNASTFIPPVGP